MDDATRTALEAAAFRRLLRHLMQDRPDVQNIDLMNMAGFCRNCLSRWYQEAAAEQGIALDKDAAREIIYGMPYADWVAQTQTEADATKKATFEVAFKQNVTDRGEPSHRGLAHFVKINFTQPRRYRPRGSGSECGAVNLDHGHDKGGCRGDEGLVRCLGLVNGEGAFLDLHLCFGGKPQDGGAGDAVQNVR